MNMVWYVHGETNDPDEWPTLFDTKLGAEKWARELFPDENPSTRYARILFKVVFVIREGEASCQEQ